MPTPFWLYRVGVAMFDSGGHRALWSETWLSTTAEVSIAQTVTSLTPVGVRLNTFWNDPFHSHNYQGQAFVERLHPGPRWTTGAARAVLFPLQSLNVNAPEAAFRLQRVGAAGGLGRMTPPILYDWVFTDLPRRRRVDVSKFAPWVRVPGALWPMTTAGFGRSYQNVVFHRRALAWEAVDHYSLLPNPVRLWARWRDSRTPPHIPLTPSFCPNEVE